MKKLPAAIFPILAAVLVAAGGGFWYYATTVDYALAQVKKDCKDSDIAGFMKKGVAHVNGSTRELTDTEVQQVAAVVKQSGQSDECPYEEAFKKKAIKSKLGGDELKRLAVPDGYKFNFEGESENKSLKIVKYKGKWRPLIADASFNAPTPLQSPGATTPPSATSPNYQIQYDTGPAAAPPPNVPVR